MNDTATFTEYMQALAHNWLRILVLLGAILVPGFLVLDYIIAPDLLFFRFAIYRSISTLIIIIQYIILRFSKPSKYSIFHGYITAITIGFFISCMTVDLGGFSSGYYAGLNLVIIGVNLLTPWKFVHSLVNGLSIVCMYVILNVFQIPSYDTVSMINNLFFMVSTVVITASFSYLRYSQLKNEFELRAKLQEAQVDEINALVKVAQVIAQGDLTVSVEKVSSGVAGSLEYAFNIMVNNLRATVQQIKELSYTLYQYGQGIKKSTDSIQHGADVQLDVAKKSASMIHSMTNWFAQNAQESQEI